MGKNAQAEGGLEAILEELDSFIDEFDYDDPEDVQVRTNALISSMIKAGVLKESRSLKGFKLQTALEHVQLPVPNRKRMVARAEMFHDLINSYGGEPDDDDMEKAHGLLVEIGDALKSAIDVKMKKRAE